MQRCDIAQWHDGLKHSRKAGMLFTTTPCWEQQFNSLLSWWMLITNELRVSYQGKSEYIIKLCYTFCMTVWVSTNLQCIEYPMKFLRCNNGTTMQSHRSCWIGTKGKVMTFLDETWANSYKPNFKYQFNEWKHPSSRPKKVHPIQCAVKVMFTVVYDTDRVTLHHTVPWRQTVNTAYYCTFLQHHLRPALWRKLWHLMV